MTTVTVILTNTVTANVINTAFAVTGTTTSTTTTSYTAATQTNADLLRFLRSSPPPQPPQLLPSPLPVTRLPAAGQVLYPDGRVCTLINELEWIPDGGGSVVLANIWYQDVIVAIDYKMGVVLKASETELTAHYIMHYCVT